MPVTVTRIYGSPDKADSALAELKRHRFSSSDIHMVSPPAAGTEGSEASTVAAIMSGGIARHRAERYAEHVLKGGTLIIVHPAFGSAALAEEVLDHFEPVDTAVSAREHDMSVDYEDDATPFSRKLGWKVLLRGKPAPFSEALGWKTLSDEKTGTYPATFKMRMLSHNPAPFSRLFGMPLLSNKLSPAAPKKLLDDPAPFSSRLGMKTLLSKPLVTGDIKLSDNPAPLSSALGLPVLTKNQ